jgi:hypothetical protein
VFFLGAAAGLGAAALGAEFVPTAGFGVPKNEKGSFFGATTLGGLRVVFGAAAGFDVPNNEKGSFLGETGEGADVFLVAGFAPSKEKDFLEGIAAEGEGRAAGFAEVRVGAVGLGVEKPPKKENAEEAAFLGSVGGVAFGDDLGEGKAKIEKGSGLAATMGGVEADF